MANEHDGNLKANYENSSTNFNNNESCKNEGNSNRVETSERDGFSASGSGYGNSKTTTASNNINHTNEYKQITSQPQRREENPFSFKHFLNRDTNSSSNSTNISATIVSTSSTLHNSNLGSSNKTSYQSLNTQNSPYPSVFNLSPNNSNNIVSSNNQTNNNGNGSNSNIGSAENEAFLAGNQSKISTSNSNSSGFGSNTSNPYQSSTGARPKVPQSISTSSSIGSGSNNILQPPISVSTTSMSSLTGGSENSKMKRSPRFSSFDSQASLAECAGGSNSDRNESAKFNSVPGGFMRDGAGILDDPGKKTGGLFITNSEYDRQFIPRSYSNYDIDVAPSIGNRCSNSSTSGRNNDVNSSPLRNRNSAAVRPNRLIGIPSQSSPNSAKNQQYASSNATNSGCGIRPNSEFAAAALPDFVQDHWMDQWYYNEMHLNSPPNSPNQSPIDFVEDLPSCIASGEKCQALPDFLSDGPIIHSSGRLADVAAGLPDLDSPEDNSPGLQLSRIRLENDRLRRELDESRIALSEQTRRANELERRLEQSRNNGLLNKTVNQSYEPGDENSDQHKKRTTSNEIQKLKLQIKQLMAEVNVLRKENELMKETGAVGGDPINRKPSRNQQLSRELMRAAANAESNLRQLLSGVDNLRLMATSLVCDNNVEDCGDGLEFNRQSPTITAASATANISNPATRNLVNDEYLSDCDDFDDFSGPAL